MTHRFALRFEEGERRGEIVALTGATTTFGRKPGNSVQLLDPSVSGKHAELVVDEKGVLLRDLGSTNGTRINGERISEKRLNGGDRVMFGSVDLVFIDGDQPKAAASASDIGLELEADEAAPPRSARAPSANELTAVVNALQVPEADAGEAVRSIGAEKLARSGKKPAFAMIGLILLAAGAGAAWWFTRGKSGDGPVKQTKPVTPVPGNLLASGYSFEASELPNGWTNASNATTRFETDRGARISGLQGLSADLGPSGNALLISEAVAADKTLQLSCAIAAQGRVEIRVGLRFESSSDAQLPVEAWGAWNSAASSEAGAAHAIELRAAAPACYDRARAMIAARSSSEAGKAILDDVSIVAGGDVALRLVKHDEVELVLLGEPASAALLFKIDHPLLSAIRFVASNGSEIALDAQADPLGMRVKAKETAGKFEFSAEAGTAAGGVATTGRDGFKTHQAQFERAGVDSVLLGAGHELVRVHFDPPIVVRGHPDAGSKGASFSLEAIGASSALVQVSFNEERVAAEGLARDARSAEKANQPAEVIQAWSRLMNEHPIDALLIAEAEAGRARALSKGLEALAAVRADVERARFFRLLELFRECRAKSLATAEAYAGSEVEASARTLAASVDKDIELLARDLDKLEARRLAQIYKALSTTKQTRLAQRVASELKSRFQVDDPAASQTANPKTGGNR